MLQYLARAYFRANQKPSREEREKTPAAEAEPSQVGPNIFVKYYEDDNIAMQLGKGSKTPVTENVRDGGTPFPHHGKLLGIFSLKKAFFA